MPPHSGSVVAPAMPRLQDPSDSPGTFAQTYASTSGLPVSVVGGIPSPRPGGLHQSCASGYDAVGFHGPRPLRLVSITKSAVPGVENPALIPAVLSARSAAALLPTPWCFHTKPLPGPAR